MTTPSQLEIYRLGKHREHAAIGERRRSKIAKPKLKGAEEEAWSERKGKVKRKA